MIKKCLFPVAGYGTRFLPATKSMPKEMLPIVDKPLIQYAVEEAVEAGIDTLIFVTNHKKRAIIDHFGLDEDLQAHLLSQGNEESWLARGEQQTLRRCVAPLTATSWVDWREQWDCVSFHDRQHNRIARGGGTFGVNEHGVGHRQTKFSGRSPQTRFAETTRCCYRLWRRVDAVLIAIVEHEIDNRVRDLDCRNSGRSDRSDSPRVAGSHNRNRDRCWVHEAGHQPSGSQPSLCWRSPNGGLRTRRTIRC